MVLGCSERKAEHARDFNRDGGVHQKEMGVDFGSWWSVLMTCRQACVRSVFLLFFSCEDNSSWSRFGLFGLTATMSQMCIQPGVYLDKGRQKKKRTRWSSWPGWVALVFVFFSFFGVCLNTTAGGHLNIALWLNDIHHIKTGDGWIWLVYLWVPGHVFLFHLFLRRWKSVFQHHTGSCSKPWWIFLTNISCMPRISWRLCPTGMHTYTCIYRR